MNEDLSLLLFVDVKDILNYKIKLDNTNSYDSIEKKKKQVGNNVINNAWVLYNNRINNIIEEEIASRFYLLDDIECNEYNQNESILTQIMLTRKTAKDFSDFVILKCGDSKFINEELINILKTTVEKYLEKQQQTTTKNIQFNGKTPKLFVLKRLEKIALELNNEISVSFTRKKLNQIIKETLDYPDPRTHKQYFECIKTFSKQYGGITPLGFNEMVYNLTGFSDTVMKLLVKNQENDTK